MCLFVYLSIPFKSTAILEGDQTTVNNLQLENNDNLFEDHLSPDNSLVTLIGTFAPLPDHKKDLFNNENTTNSIETDEAYRMLEIYAESTHKNNDLNKRVQNEINRKTLKCAISEKEISPTILLNALIPQSSKRISLNKHDNRPRYKLLPFLTFCIKTGIYSFAECLLMVINLDKYNECFDKTSNLDDFPEGFRFITDKTAKRNSQKTVGTPKRISFYSWGGKRFNQEGAEIQASRLPFNAWGGKRQISKRKQFVANKEMYETYKRPKLKFYSWGGKRNWNYDE